MCTTITPQFLSNDYASFGLTDDSWLPVATLPTISPSHYLYIQQTDGQKNGCFRIVSNTIKVFDNAQTPSINTNSHEELVTGDKIYFFDGQNYTQIGAVSSNPNYDGLYDDLTITFTDQMTSQHLSDLGEYLQYAGASLDSRTFQLYYYTDPDEDGIPLIEDGITFNKTGDGFTFGGDASVNYAEDSPPVFAAPSTTTIAYAEKDQLNNSIGNYNATRLTISATSDLSAMLAQLKNADEQTPEGMQALLKSISVMFSEFSAHELNIDTTGKSFSYDAGTQTLKVGDTEFAKFYLGGTESDFPTKSIIDIDFNSDLATTALVNEVLQSITYKNTGGALQSLGIISWDLKNKVGENWDTFVSGQSLLNFSATNDAPAFKTSVKAIGDTSLTFDFNTQTFGETATKNGVYHTENALVLSYNTIPENNPLSFILDYLSNGAATLVGNNSLFFPDNNSASSTISLTTPQTSVTLEFANLIKQLLSLGEAVSDEQTGLMLMASTPYRKVSFFDANNELLGISEITDADLPSLSLLFGMQAPPAFRSTLLADFALDALYNVSFTAPQGSAITSIKIETGSGTMLSSSIGDGLPFVLDRLVLGGEVTPYFDFSLSKSLTAPTEFFVGSVFPNGMIADADFASWQKNDIPKAVGISAVESSKGTWKYKIGTGDWTAFDFSNHEGTVLLLDATDQLQFTPNESFTGEIVDAITFYAWDKTTGTAGEYLTIAGNTGGSHTLSAVGLKASAITPPSEPPVIGGIVTGDVTDTDDQIVKVGTATYLDNTKEYAFVTDSDSKNFNGGHVLISYQSGTEDGQFLFEPDVTINEWIRVGSDIDAIEEAIHAAPPCILSLVVISYHHPNPWKLEPTLKARPC